MANILTNEQVKEALYLDDDANLQMLDKYSRQATSYIFHKTGYDFSQDLDIEPLAILCAELYIRQIHFGSTGYNKQHDYLIGIGGLIADLQIIAEKKNQELGT